MAAKTKKKAVKKASKKKTASKKTVSKKKTARKRTTGGISKGDRYKCSVCGVAVTIDEVCGCMDVCDIVCCDKQMKPVRKGKK